jgi:hypothetical protein
MITRIGNQGAQHNVGGIELKWWRHGDRTNASNRRRDLVRDFIRAASVYPSVQDFAFVALLSTEVSWTSTTSTHGADETAMGLVTADDGSKIWNVHKLRGSPAVRGAVRSLRGRVPVPNIFHSKLLSSVELRFASGRSAFARVWSIRKPQRTHFLTDAELQEVLL